MGRSPPPPPPHLFSLPVSRGVLGFGIVFSPFWIYTYIHTGWGFFGRVLGGEGDGEGRGVWCWNAFCWMCGEWGGMGESGCGCRGGGDCFLVLGGCGFQGWVDVAFCGGVVWEYGLFLMYKE